MVKKYQETAQFVYGARDVTELRNLSLFMGEPQKFIVRQALVLSDTDYQNFINDDFRKPPVAIRVKQRYMGFDVKKKAWNCLLVVSEIGKEGILVGKEPDAEHYYMAYVPDHTNLNLPHDLRAIAFDRTGRPGQALDAARSALALEPENERLRGNVALLERAADACRCP